MPRGETRGDRCYRRSILLNGKETEKKVKSKEVEAPKKELDNLMTALEKTGFWKMPKEDNAIVPEPSSDQDNSGSHGTIVIVEAVKAGKYLARLRLAPRYQSEERGLVPLVEFLYQGSQRGEGRGRSPRRRSRKRSIRRRVRRLPGRLAK